MLDLSSMVMTLTTQKRDLICSRACTIIAHFSRNLTMRVLNIEIVLKPSISIHRSPLAGGRNGCALDILECEVAVAVVFLPGTTPLRRTRQNSMKLDKSIRPNFLPFSRLMAHLWHRGHRPVSQPTPCTYFIDQLHLK